MNVYHHKLYALLHNPQMPYLVDAQQMQCLKEHLPQLQSWWHDEGQQSQDIGSASDRVNVNYYTTNTDNKVRVSHLISGQSQQVETLRALTTNDIADISAAINELFSVIPAALS